MSRLTLLIRLLLLTLSVTGVSVTGATVAVTPSSLDPAPLRRLDPALRALAEQPVRTPPSDLHVTTGPFGVRYVSVLLLADGDASFAALTALGARVQAAPKGTGVPVVLSAELPLDRLREVAAWPGLRFASAAYGAAPLLDKSVPDIRADLVHSTLQKTGKGVLIAVIDSGIDLRHPDFLDANGKSRIRALWDQTDPQGPHPSGYDFGREYTADEINAALGAKGELPTDDDPAQWSHGTLVAGVAAGGGGGTPFVGVAPEADLIVVKWDGYHGVDANRYAADKAAALGLPIALNNSWGGQEGSHDGTDPEGQALNGVCGETRPGCAVVFAAGNSGGAAIHLNGALKKNMISELPIYAPNGQKECRIEFWADAAATWRLQLKYPATLDNSKRGAVVVRSGESIAYDLPDDPSSPYGRAHIEMDARSRPYEPNPSLQLISLYLDLRNTSGGTLPGLNWSLSAQRTNDAGQNAFDAWITTNPGASRFEFSTAPAPMRGDRFRTLVNEACASGVLAVGSHITKLEWTAENGSPQTDDPAGLLKVGDLSPFSSSGPTRDGRHKPELTAPGQVIASSLSQDFYVPQGARRFITADGGHMIAEGTSMAAPHVAGTLALMLQQDPTLDTLHFRELLKRSARFSTGWTPQGGWGHLDAFGAVTATAMLKSRAPGDLDGDGRITVADAVLAMKMSIAVTTALPEDVAVADVSPPRAPGQERAGDGRITILDVVRLLRRSVNLEPDPWP